ncbi:hypothetical protein halTADL_3278 [Halohasta litchfieldiae]|jgi:hypothetical protein|uniref:Uncharacterized protein n=1 Tax=Halohasta litchfieldiae TaxID=1073996 RepID=A0A1H6SBS7_9EURY|nr:hypothetical protein [Halohasta litchfieldiae]ATW89980.1 hypothetical protein halTADL_3278 [Halohasta litchfieldiae]SEI65588.1 hypothetical protein SAMN05444271_1059 [Halohasta litchfieldiae]
MYYDARLSRPDTGALSLTTTLTTEYWVVDEAGHLADPDLIAGLPGAAGTASPYSVAVETPPCERCVELEAALDARLAATVEAAHDRSCRLLGLGLRPDLLTESASPVTDQPPVATAGTRVSFEPDPAASTDLYNVLLALDPAFVLVNTTSRAADGQQYACGRPSLYHRGSIAQYRFGDVAVGGPSSNDTATAATDSSTDWQPVALLDDGSRVEWRSLDPTTPTLLVDLIADIKTILQQARHHRLSVDSFGNGFHGDRLVLPNEEWRAIYAQEAVEKGLSSLLVRAYLERLGVDTGWYLAATPPTVSAAADMSMVCRQHAAHLEADIGARQTS